MSFRKKRSLAAPKGLFGFFPQEAGTQQERRAQKNEQDREELCGRENIVVFFNQKFCWDIYVSILTFFLEFGKLLARKEFN